MRLLNVHTFEIEQFLGRVPGYAILSHAWGPEEVMFQDMQGPREEYEKKAGFAKLKGCCEMAKANDFEWCWIDTCCIDKTNSTELSEAINSMYRFYRDALVCYVYMEDVETAWCVADPCWGGVFDLRGTFRESRWFTRGWTLQELIAPDIVEFFAKDWSDFGTKAQLRQQIADVTGVPLAVLDGEEVSKCNVAERISWAARRTTTKLEDAAYCLLGILGVNMPLLYGEGAAAFIRLQEEVLKTKDDLTLLAWGAYPWADADEFVSAADARWYRPEDRHCRTPIELEPTVEVGPLATSAADFRVKDEGKWRYDNLRVDTEMHSHPFAVHEAWITPRITSKGLHLSLPLLQVEGEVFLAYLQCRMQDDALVCMALRCTGTGPGSKVYRRVFSGHDGYWFVHHTQLEQFRIGALFIAQDVELRRGPNVQYPVEYAARVRFRLDAAPHIGLRKVEMSMTDVVTSFGEGQRYLLDSVQVHREPFSSWDYDRWSHQRRLTHTRMTAETSGTEIVRLKFAEGSSIVIVFDKRACAILTPSIVSTVHKSLRVIFDPDVDMEGVGKMLQDTLTSLLPQRTSDRACATLPSGLGDVLGKLRRTGAGICLDVRIGY